MSAEALANESWTRLADFIALKTGLRFPPERRGDLQRGFAAEPFDALITDLGMPYVDGRQVAAAVRAMAADTPIILLTGWGQRMAAENEVPEVNCVLAKPPRLRELRAVLAELTAGPGAQMP